MLRLFILLCLFHLCFLPVFSQAHITIGAPYAVVNGFAKYYFDQNGEIMAVKVAGKSIVVQKMSAASLKMLQVRTYDDFPIDYKLEQVLQFKDRYYVFYSLYEEPQEQLFARELDFASGTFKGPARKVLSIDGRIAPREITNGFMSQGHFVQMPDAVKYSFSFSYDNTALAIQYRLEPETRRDAKNFDIIGVHVFGPTMKEKWGKKVTMPFTEKKMDNLDYSVDAAGNVYLVARVYHDDTTEQAEHTIEIFKIAAGTGEITPGKVDAGDKFIQRFWLFETAQGAMMGAGYYNNDNSFCCAAGMVLFKFNADGSVTDLKTVAIPVDVFNEYAGKPRRNERRDAVRNILLKDVIVQEDGSVVLIGEQSIVTASSSGTPTGYHYHDILVAKIDAAGKLAWIRKLPKRQIGGASQGGKSYRYLAGGNSHYFLFLDHEKNLNLPKDEEPVYHEDGMGGFLMCYKLNDKSGEIQKSHLLNARDVQGIELFEFGPSRFLNTAPNTLIFEAYKKNKEDVLVKVVIRL